MLNFRHFLSQDNGGLDIPVVSISESLSNQIDEINDKLDNTLTECFMNPYIGWVNASKVLAPYGILLPRTLFRDIQEGVEVVALNLNESDEEHYFYYEYNFVKEGYNSFASIVNQTELDELLAED